MGHVPTLEQQAVIDAFTAGGNVTVSAYAGAGKTSTLVQAAAANPDRRIIFTAFNRKIIDDSAKKFGLNVRCKTTHSLASHVANADSGWRWNRMKAPRMHGRPLASLLRINDPIRVLGTDVVLSPARLGSLTLMMVDRFANSGEDEPRWWHMPEVPGIEGRETRRMIGTALLPACAIAWADITHPGGKLRYQHNYYRKEWALTHPRIDADAIMVDEAQDSAGVFVRLLEDQVKYGVQVVSVGDQFQAINGWAGAVDAMDKFEGTRLHITQSFRFGPELAHEANKWLTLLGAEKPLRGNDAIDTRIIEDMAGPDAILARTNGTVVKEVVGRLTQGQKVAMLGKPDEILAFIRGARDLKERMWSSHHDLMAFGSWQQVQDYVDNDDAGADMKVLVNVIDQHGCDALEDAMASLSSPAYADVVLSTAHKCKGAEWGKVKIADDFKAPKPDDNGRLTVSREAGMLNYVAITRAQTHLDRGPLSWVDEAVKDLNHRALAPVAPAAVERIEVTPGGIELGPHESPFYIAPASPAPSEDGGLEEFTAAVRATLSDPHTACCAWVAGHIRDGQLAGVGRGQAKWAAVTGPVGAPTVSWHRYRNEAEAVAGVKVAVPA